jgi:hypothetical protein
MSRKVVQDHDPRALANEYEDESDDEEHLKAQKEEAKKLRWGHPTYDIVSLLKETGCIPEIAPEVVVDTEAIAKAGAEFLKQNNNSYAKAGKAGFTFIPEEEKPKDEDKKTENPEKEKDSGDKIDTKPKEGEESKEDKPKEEKKEKPKKNAEQLMKEQNITNKMFWELEEGDFENMLEVKEFGTRKKLMKKIK